MINYSVFLMNNHLYPGEAPKAYATNQSDETLTLDAFVRHISNHNGVFSRGTVKAVICDMCDCLRELLLDGKSVQMGELGRFSITLSCEGAMTKNDFTADNIKAVNVVFKPGADLTNLIADATFNPVASRSAQAATLAAEKAGKGTVDLTASKKAKD